MTRLPTINDRRRSLADIERDRRRREAMDLGAMVVLLLVLAVALVTGWRATNDRTEAAMAVEVGP